MADQVPVSSTPYTMPARNDVPWYTFQITLSGSIFNLIFRFNTRNNRWFMDINDAVGNPVLLGVPLLVDTNLFGQYTSLNLPDGIMFPTDDTGTGIQPTLYSFGTECTLWYYDLT